MHDNEIDKFFIFMKMEFKAGKITVNHHDHSGSHDVELYQIDTSGKRTGFDTLKFSVCKIGVYKPKTLAKVFSTLVRVCF